MSAPPLTMHTHHQLRALLFGVLAHLNRQFVIVEIERSLPHSIAMSILYRDFTVFEYQQLLVILIVVDPSNI